MFSIAYSPCGHYFVTGSYNVLRVWNAVTWECLRSMEGHKWPVESINYSPDGVSIVTVSSESVRIWDAATGECLHILEGFENSISSATYSPDGKVIAVADFNTVRIYDAVTATHLATLICLKDNNWVVIAPDGRYDSSDAGECQQLRWTILTKSYPVTQFKDRYYAPNLLGQILHA
jgi:WD40 repeat protein